MDKYDNYLRMEMRLKYPAMAKSKKEYRTITDLFYIINRYKKDFLSFSKKLFVGAKYLNQSALEAKIQTHFGKAQARNLITFVRLYNEKKINYNNDTKAKINRCFRLLKEKDISPLASALLNGNKLIAFHNTASKIQRLRMKIKYRANIIFAPKCGLLYKIEDSKAFMVFTPVNVKHIKGESRPP